jgi:hypothetical protein
MTSEISELKGRLKANPAYYMSLGSRELFHSNLLGWMFEKYPRTVSILMDPVASDWSPDRIKVERERKHLDLLITYSRADECHAVVVEVKVKDVPAAKQLAAYDGEIKKLAESSLRGYAVRKVILSLVEVPDEMGGPGSWRSLKLAELGRRIMEWVGAGYFNADDDMIIRQYARLCIDLGELAAKAAEVDRQGRIYFFERPGMEIRTAEIDAAMRDLRFDDTLNKRRASELRWEIERRAAGIDLLGLQLHAYNSLSNKTPFVGAYLSFVLRGEPVSRVTLAVDIQGRQYRRVLSFDRFGVARSSAGKDAAAIKAFIEKTDGWRWMFGTFRDKGVFTSPHGQDGFFGGMVEIPTGQQVGKLLCSYHPKYIYQYTNIGDGGLVPVDCVVDAVLADLQYAARLLIDTEYVHRFENWSPGSS